MNMNLDHIQRSMDGRFVPKRICIDQNDSDGSESDDGGFLPHRRRQTILLPCCQPMATYANQLAIMSNANCPSLRFVQQMRPTQQHLLRTVVPIEYHNRPTYQDLNSLRRMMPPSAYLSPQTSTRLSRIVSSSPAVQNSSINSTIRSPHTTYFSDLSSVQQPSSVERSISHPRSNISQLRYLQERYAQELPSLHAIHEEKQRMAQGFVPLQIELHSPSLRQYHEYRQHSHMPIVQQRQRRFLPRFIRTGPQTSEFTSPISHLRPIEASPESQTSSSGFGSKNTSTQHNHSSQSDHIREWREVPPYRPPPQYHTNWTDLTDSSSSYTMEHWMGLINRMNGDSINVPKAVDVGSVDGHYEFDPSTPTPSASTPTGTRDDLFITDHSHHQFTTAALMHTQSLQPHQRKRVSKYDNIEARVQAMKEEFHTYRQRQAMQQHANISAC